MSTVEPRWLDREATARYLSVRVDELPRLLRAGKLPVPSYHLGPKSPRWDRLALDACFVGGVASTDPDIAVAGLVQQIKDEALGRARRP
ncbi:helix-turn-helix transcriptional regulator [Crenalkalicoccus roseus]|uniref:helix-turn-helix transcriptional regulator n=1 Tax=Crenalkalicoccus roseus TaxID=1485588 RepID=UPI001080D06D|nr:hypothetical protein [Crenalkalicoccus roseus]